MKSPGREVQRAHAIKRNPRVDGKQTGTRRRMHYLQTENSEASALYEAVIVFPKKNVGIETMPAFFLRSNNPENLRKLQFPFSANGNYLIGYSRQT